MTTPLTSPFDIRRYTVQHCLDKFGSIGACKFVCYVIPFLLHFMFIIQLSYFNSIPVYISLHVGSLVSFVSRIDFLFSFFSF